MKAYLITLLLFILPPICYAQQSISRHLDEASRAHYLKLLQGYWVRVNDTNETILITKDSIFRQKKYDNKKVEDMHLLRKSKYAYMFTYKDSNSAAPQLNRSLEKWRGYYLHAWDNSHKQTQFWTEAVYSITNKYLYLGYKGEHVYKRMKETKAR